MAMTAREKREARNKQAIEAGAPTEVEKLNQAQFAGHGAHPASGPMLPQTRTRQYVVGCKLGVASYSIQLSRMVKKFEQNMQGGREVTEAERVGPVVVLRGTAYPRGTVPEGFPPPPIIVDGAALNFGIDADWMDEWLEQHARDPIVLNKLIFAREKEEDARAIAREHSGIRSGLEPLSPKGDPRAPKSNNPAVDNVTEDKARLGSRREAG
jgi:hypothetical protein